MSDKPEILFDRRTAERNLATGRITRREYDSFLSHLADAKDKSQPLFPDEPEEEAGEAQEGDAEA